MIILIIASVIIIGVGAWFINRPVKEAGGIFAI